MEKKEELEKKTGVKCISSIDGIKKFDICLMNPPYDKNLHLKFLEKVINICDKVVSIQPCEFIARTHLKPTYKNQKEKYKDTIGKHLKNLEVLEDMPFDAGIDTNLGIYVLDDDGGFDYENFYKEFDKNYLTIENKFKTEYTLKDKLETFNKQKYFVPLRTDGIYERWWTLQLINYLDVIVDGKVYSGAYKGLTIPEARTKNPHENPRNANRTTIGISFDSLNDTLNFRDMLKTEAFLFIMMLFKTTRKNPMNKVPFINIKEKPTNDNIFDLFDIDKNIRDEIIDDMQPFKQKSSLSGNEIGELLRKLQTKYLKLLNN